MRPLLLLSLLAGCGPAPLPEHVAPADGWTPGETPVSLVLPAIGGGDVDLAAFRGRPVLLNYFATWCVPCAAELRRFQRLHAEGGPQSVAIVAVSLDEKPKRVAAFVEVSRLQFPVAMADEATRAGQTPLGPLPAVPTSYLLDPDGRAVERFRGVVPIAYLQRRANELAR